jgi:hypothetical protein
MRASISDVKKRPKRIMVFEIGKIWTFKYFFGDKEIFKELADHYNRANYRFEFKTRTELEEAQDILRRHGFDIDLAKDLSEYVVKLDKSHRYAPVLKNSVEYTETKNERIFLMKDLVAVEEALDFGAQLYDGIVPF